MIYPNGPTPTENNINIVISNPVTKIGRTLKPFTNSGIDPYRDDLNDTSDGTLMAGS